MNNSESTAKWHIDEKEWWNKYADIMTYQWKLTPELNKTLRQDLEYDYNKYLFKAGGRLLDLGCGSGWLSMSFSKKGMSVLGIDFSQEQIEAANDLKRENKLDDVTFECRNLAQWDCSKHEEEFDSVFVSAFLHHLPFSEIETILYKISFVLKPGGRAYFYEPLSTSSYKRKLNLLIFDLPINVAIGFLIGRFPKWFNLWTPWYQSNVEAGYRGNSPHERPLDVEWIRKTCSKSLSITEVKCWHLNSLGFAMQTMTLKPRVRSLYSRLVTLLYWADRVLLATFDWRHFASPGRFILCSLKAEKIR